MKRKLLDNLKRVQDRIETACARAGRSAQEVSLVAVTKYVSLEAIRTMIEAGFTDLAENRAQEFARRAAAMHEWMSRRTLDAGSTPLKPPRWHMIGHLQRNKVKLVLPWAHLVHSVDTLRLAEDIDARSARENRVTSVLLEVNASGEPSKNGVAFPACVHLAEVIDSLTHVKLCGLMAMGPLVKDEAHIRLIFERVRDLFDEARSRRIGGDDFNILSMGMSGDLEYAIETGATQLRIGQALYEGIEGVDIRSSTVETSP